jgi:multidrug efflux pump subunit AcrB
MAITIIGGLMFATMLNMVVVPVVYSIFYRD